jgi:hypothetical protein
LGVLLVTLLLLLLLLLVVMVRVVVRGLLVARAAASDGGSGRGSLGVVARTKAAGAGLVGPGRRPLAVSLHVTLRLLQAALQLVQDHGQVVQREMQNLFFT